MRVNNVAWVALGTFIGVGIVFYQVDMPKHSDCQTYRVASKTVTAYVLKPPPAEVRYEACPQTTTNVLTKPEKIDTSPERVDETDISEKPRRHRRHHRVRRYWR